MSLSNLMMLVCIAESSCVWDEDSCRDDCDEIAIAQICSEFTSNMVDCEEAELCDWFDDTDFALSSEDFQIDDAAGIMDNDGGANNNEEGSGSDSSVGDANDSDVDAVTTSTLPPSTTEEEGCCLHRGNDRENMACSNMGSKKCDIEGSCEWVTEDPECAKDHTVDEEGVDEESNVSAGIIDNDSGAAATTDDDEVDDEVDEDARQSRSIGGDDEDAEDDEVLDEDGRSSRSIGGDDEDAEDEEVLDEDERQSRSIGGDEEYAGDNEGEDSNEPSFGDVEGDAADADNGDENDDVAGDESDVAVLEAHLIHLDSMTSTLPPSTTEEAGCCLHRGNERENMACSNMGSKKCDIEGSCEWVGAEDPDCAEDHTVNEDEEEQLDVPALEAYLTHRRNRGGGADEIADILEDHLTHRRRRGEGDDAPEQALFADTANPTQRNKGFPGAWSMILIGIVAVLAVRSWHKHKGAKANSKPSQMSDYGAISLV